MRLIRGASRGNRHRDLLLLDCQTVESNWVLVPLLLGRVQFLCSTVEGFSPLNWLPKSQCDQLIIIREEQWNFLSWFVYRIKTKIYNKLHLFHSEFVQSDLWVLAVGCDWRQPACCCLLTLCLKQLSSSFSFQVRLWSTPPTTKPRTHWACFTTMCSLLPVPKTSLLIMIITVTNPCLLPPLPQLPLQYRLLITYK